MLRFILIALGAMAVISAMVDLMGAVELEPSDEASIGISRHSVLAYFIVQLLAGFVMLFLGFRRRK